MFGLRAVVSLRRSLPICFLVSRKAADSLRFGVLERGCVQAIMSLHAYWTQPSLAKATGRRMDIRVADRCIVDSVGLKCAGFSRFLIFNKTRMASEYPSTKAKWLKKKKGKKII